MARKIRVKSGNTTATVDDQLARSIEHTLKALAPDTTREIEKAIERIYQEGATGQATKANNKQS